MKADGSRSESEGGGEVSESAESVHSLNDYRPTGKTYQVSLTFSGDASQQIGDLMARLHTDDINEVVKRAIALLVSAKGKDILLRDPKTGSAEAVDF